MGLTGKLTCHVPTTQNDLKSFSTGNMQDILSQAHARSRKPRQPSEAMLLQRMKSLQFLLLLLVLNMATNCASASSSSIGRGDDERALMAFKDMISHHSGVLASWNQSTSYCSWEGIVCSKRHRRRVVALNLASQGLAGTISPAVSNLTFLRLLNLSSNSLQGEISPSIGSLRRLQRLDLRKNLLTGVIPSNISSCTSLKVMIIEYNMLQGSIPAEIGDMLSLTHLGLANNSISGTIPSSFGNLTQLTVLDLPGNHLEGPIPAGIGNIPSLGFLQLSENNLSGLLPTSLYNISSLYLLSVSANKLHGRLPADLGKSLPSIQVFRVDDNRFTGTIPSSISNLTMLKEFVLAANKFAGVVPSMFARLQNLEVFVLDANMFEANNDQDWGFIASLTNCSRLQALSIGWNRFEGKLPSLLVNLSTTLQWLRVTNNHITGAIPSEIGNLASLEVFDPGENSLTGVIPESIGKLTQLQQLFLESNNLSGRIPSSIGNLTALYLLDIAENNMEGPIPRTIGNMIGLQGLDLSNNKLTGMIPNEIMKLPSLSMMLNLSYNLLEGPLPLEVGSLVNLQYLSLSGNKLSGEIPDTLGNCRVLDTLLMDHNSFQGSIPATFENMAGLTLLNLTNNKLNGSIPAYLGSITNMQELYLAQNNLSGPIPEHLGNSKSLLRLDLSFNNLQGEVPMEGVFRNSTGLSIVGNRELCGGIIQLHLPKCPKTTALKNKKSMTKSLRIAIPIVGALLFLLSGLALAGFFYRKLKTGLEKEVSSPFTEIKLPIVPYKDILKGTDGFSEANVLGKGRYGTVYRGTLGDPAAVMAVKVFNLQQSGSYKSFQAECEALRRVRHRCLVKIITCCSSINHQGEDFRALVFELMPNGSLDRWIHSDFRSRNGKGVLSLSQRLDIAIDIVDALDYLHNSCQPSIIHCDLKPSNILLNQEMRARVGDFGIARIVGEATSKQPVNSNSSIGIRGSIGYVAPEYGEGLAVSTYGDVYSLGVTLIEMFTGKSPTDSMFRDGLNLHYFAEAALPDKVMEIADSNIWVYDEASNSNDTRRILRTKECLAAVIKLGVMCSKQLAIERLSMSDAAAEMHAIRDIYMCTE
ncbi:hypothetical protein ACP4OV_031078 [Aristida adscensionis]